MCRIIQIFPRLNGQSCGFLPFPYSQQGYTKFNSWWAAYNSSSLGANMTGGSGFPYKKQTGHLQQYVTMSKSFFPPPPNYVQYVLFQDYHPHHTCSFTSLNLEVIWRRPTSRKENSILKWRKLEGHTIHPQSISTTPNSATVQFSVQLRSVGKYWQLERVLSLFFSFLLPLPMVKGHQKLGKRSFLEVRNKKLTKFCLCDNSKPVGERYWRKGTIFILKKNFPSHTTISYKESRES